MRHFIFLCFAVSTCVVTSTAYAAISFKEGDRVLVVAPHPDDETLGTAGVMQTALASKAQVRVVYLTHGDHNEISSLFYMKRPLLTKTDFIKSGLVRRVEAQKATAILGLKKENLIFLGYPDSGVLRIWLRHWGKMKPYRSILTRINKVPYKEDFSFGNEYRGENILADLKNVIHDFKPTHVFVTAPFDGNSDHKAAFLFLNVALKDLESEITPPAVYSYLIHSLAWPKPRAYLPDEKLTPPSEIEWENNAAPVLQPLTKEEVEKKNRAILEYQSQTAYNKKFLLSFARSNELFFNASAASVETVSYTVKDRELWVQAKLSHFLDERGTFTIELFGYKKNTDFAVMPKINMRLIGKRLYVYSGRRKVSDSGVTYQLGKRSLKIRVPLTYLKDPDMLFVSTHTAKGEALFDFGSWKIVAIRP
jgi:LmbE family N-acetylglucosaminyl deacetylase